MVDAMYRMIRRFVVTPAHRAGPHHLCLMMAGVLGIIWPPPSISAVTQGVVAVYLWLGSLAIGGLLCSIGRWRRTRGPKILGLILILTALTTYELALLSVWPESASTIFVLLAFSFLLLYRLEHVKKCRDADIVLRGRAGHGPDLAAYARNHAAIPGSYRRWLDRRSMGRRQAQEQEQRGCPNCSPGDDGI